MPAVGRQPHFDVEALIEAVHQQKTGLRISTNNVEGFKRLVYEASAAQPSRAVHIYTVPNRPSSLALLPRPLGA